jgi:ankyrin repeat protein
VHKHISKTLWRTAGLTVLAVGAAAPWAVALGGAPVQDSEAAPARRTTTDPPVAPVGKLGQELFMAVGKRDIAGLKDLLAKGADANSRNGLELTPLFIAAASHQPDAMNALLAGGAKADYPSQYGTPLTFAAATGHTAGAKILIGKGANVNFARVDGITVLMMAAQGGSPDFVAEVLKAGAKVNETNNVENSALHYAVRNGHLEVGKLLLEAGAKVNQLNNDKQTPLMWAAMNGNLEFAELLLSKGAKVNIRDAQGRTPLMLAANYGDNPGVVEALVKAGAKTEVTDPKGKTAADMAAAKGYSASANILGKPVAVKPRAAAQGASAGLKVIQSSMVTFGERAECVSCHQEGLGRWATGVAESKGLTINQKLDSGLQARIRGALGALKPLNEGALQNPELMKQIPLIEMGEAVPGYSWVLGGMAAHGDTATQATAAWAMVLGRLQMPDGSWTFGLPRVPMQSSTFTFTALTLRSLALYGPRAYSAEIADRMAKGKAWLMGAPAQTSDDLAFRLLGLKWAGATSEELRKATEELLAAQLPDGGWAQLPGMKSDAYATGQALYAMQTAGELGADDLRIASGVQYLLRTQDADGSWYVSKRALPANNYFDAGFPHGESQYASFNGTCWATMALLEAAK